MKNHDEMSIIFIF